MLQELRSLNQSCSSFLGSYKLQEHPYQPLFCKFNFACVGFQKISIATPGMVMRNSEAEGVLKTKIFKGKYEANLKIPGGRSEEKSFPWGRYGYFLEPYNIRLSLCKGGDIPGGLYVDHLRFAKIAKCAHCFHCDFCC